MGKEKPCINDIVRWLIDWLIDKNISSSIALQAPQFAQSSYVFNMTDCSAGQFVAAVQANNPSISQIAYSIDNYTGQPYNVAVNYQTGQINLVQTPLYKFKFNYRATNFYGAAVVPITVRCGNTNTNGIDILCFNNFCSNVSKGNYFDFTVGTCYPGMLLDAVPARDQSTERQALNINQSINQWNSVKK